MSALISGLLDLLQWLASTFAAFGSWLVDTVRRVAEWVLRLVEYPLVWLWNAAVDVLTWVLNAVFWLLGHLLDVPLTLLQLLVSLLPNMPPSLQDAMDRYVVPAYNIANQIFPLSEAITFFSIWATFYGLFALWRFITFLRGGR
jgi:hypothetical protein